MLDIITREEIKRRIYDIFNIKLNERGCGENFEETIHVCVHEHLISDGFYVSFTYKIDDNKEIELTRRNVKTFDDLDHALYDFDYIVTLVRQ